MKKTALLSFLFFALLNSNAQELTLKNLVSLCNKNTWEEVNQSLLSQQWSYSDIQQGDSLHCKTLFWLFKNEEENSQGQAWLTLYTEENVPSKIVYTVLNKESYQQIRDALAKEGFKAPKRLQKIFQNTQGNSLYYSKKYTLSLTTENQKASDVSSESTMAYTITLLKKSGVYDHNNGLELDYWPGSKNIQAKYTLEDGTIQGEVINYYEDGVIQLVTQYKNGLEDGPWKLYRENGTLEASGYCTFGSITGVMKGYAEDGSLLQVSSMSNSKKNGTTIFYKDNKKSEEQEYVNDVLQGKYKSYVYDDEGNVQFIQQGNYLNDEKNGRWNWTYMDKNGKAIETDFINYTQGKLDGKFQVVRGDSLVICTCRSNLKVGDFKVYLDTNAILVPGLISTDTANMVLAVSGKYNNGLQEGQWNYFDSRGTLVTQGSFSSNLKIGLWSYYYPTRFDRNHKLMPSSGQLEYTETYKNGILEGMVKFYNEDGSLECEYMMKNNSIDGARIFYEDNKKKEGKYTTYTNNNQKDEELEYVDGILQGKYKSYNYNDEGELVSIVYGNNLNDERDGKWSWMYLDESGHEKEMNIVYYAKGIESGLCQSVVGDTLFLIEFSSGQQTGIYRAYLDTNQVKVGGLTSTDTANMVLIIAGNLDKDQKTGEWCVYDSMGTLIMKGSYTSDLRTGIWSFYYPTMFDCDHKLMPCSGELNETDTYENGQTKGLVQCYSYLKTVPCVDKTSISSPDAVANTSDTKVCIKYNKSFYYNMDKIEGPFVVKDSTGLVISQGHYSDGLKDGLWLESDPNEDEEPNVPAYIFQKGNYLHGKRTGEWITYLTDEQHRYSTLNYSFGKFNGMSTFYTENGGKEFQISLKEDSLKEILLYDSMGVDIIERCEVLEDYSSYYKLRDTKYSASGSISQDFYTQQPEPKVISVSSILSALKGIDIVSYTTSVYCDGEYKRMDQEGNILEVGNIIKDEKLGLWKRNYRAQNIQIRTEYVHNVPGPEIYYTLDTNERFSGVFTSTNKETGVKEDYQIKNGLKQ